jgi:hypothetical protein
MPRNSYLTHPSNFDPILQFVPDYVVEHSGARYAHAGTHWLVCNRPWVMEGRSLPPVLARDYWQHYCSDGCPAAATLAAAKRVRFLKR